MQKYTGVVIDGKGAPMGGVTVQVNVAGGSAATIYSDDGLTVKGNPFINDVNGSFEFYAANGRYDIVLSKTGATFNPSDTSDIALYDSGPNPASPAILHIDGGDSGTPASTAETTLKSFTIPGDTLVQDDDLIRFRATGRTGANANTKRIRAKFGATTLIDSTAVAFNNNAWVIEGIIVRTGGAIQRAVVAGVISANNPAWTNTALLGGQSTTTPAETLSDDVLLEITGQNGAATANDIICDSLVVEYLRKP